MSFYKRYELRRLVADGEVKTFTAVENETGRDVLLHMFNPPGLPLLAEFKRRFLLADGRSAPPAIEVGEFAGSQYAVTSTIDSFQSLRQWMHQGEPLGAAAGAPVAPEGPREPTAAVTPVADDLGDFTRAFGSAPPKAPPAAAPLNEDPGDFTRAFGSSGPRVDPPRPQPGAPAGDHGDFTRAFGSTPPKAAPAPRPGAPLNEDPGDLTRAFGSSGPRVDAPRPQPSAPAGDDGGFGSSGPQVDPPPTQPGAPAGGHGDFTRAFGSVPPKAAPPANDDPGDFTRAFGWSGPRVDPPRPQPGAPAGDDGDFTRGFGSAPPGAAPAARPAPPLNDDPDDFASGIGSSGQRAGPPRPQAGAPASDEGEYARLFGGSDALPPAPPAARPTAQIPRPAAAQPAWPAAPPAVAPPQAPPRPTASLPAMPQHDAADTGEFTKLFGSGPVGQSIDIAEEQAKAARTAPQESRPFQQAGEFTRIFGPELGGPQSAPPRDTTSSLNTSASSLFGSPEDLARQANAALSHSDHAENTGDYERIFGGSSTSEAPPAALKRAPTAPAARLGPSPLTIVLITLGAAILVAGLIYLAVLLGNKP